MFTYSTKVDELDALFESAVAQAGNSGFNPADFFNNGANGNQGNVQFISNKKENQSDEHWSDGFNMSKNGVNAWITAPFQWIGNKISPLLPDFWETDGESVKEKQQELSQRRVTVDKLDSIKSSTLSDMNRAVLTEDTIRSSIRATEMQIDAIKAAGDTGKAVIVIGSFFLPGPEDAVMAAVLSKHGLTVIKNGGGYIVKRGATILSGKQERDALITVTTEVRKHGSDVSKLTGKSFEEYLAKLFGGKSSFTTNGREFDGAYGKVWYEAKSGQYWANQCKTKTQIGKFQSDIGDHLKIAKENGKLFELHSNTPIPSNIKKWLESKGIKYFEHL